MNRDKRLDIMRGLMMVLVIIGHAIDLLYGKGIAIEENVSGGVYKIIYMFHMPVMFFVSGYVEAFNKKKVSNKDILKKNIISLYIPYLFLTYLYLAERLIALYVFKIELEATVLSSIGEFIELAYIGRGLEWFLMSLLIIKCIFEIGRKYINIKWLTVFFAIMFVLRCFFENKLLEYLAWGIFYCIGYLVKVNEECIIKSRIIGIGLYISIYVGYILNVSQQDVLFIVKLLVGIPVAILLLKILTKISVKSVVFQWCGINSMVIYMVHGLTQYITFIICSKVLPIHSVGILVFLMVLMQLSMAKVVIYMYKNIKLFTWIEYIFYPWKWYKSNIESKNKIEE